MIGAERTDRWVAFGALRRGGLSQQRVKLFVNLILTVEVCRLQQLAEHHAQAINVAGDGHRAAIALLRAGVAR